MLAAFILVVFVAAIVIVQTDWFRNFVKRKIVAATEESTRGAVEIGSFAFDWTHMRAVVDDFVIHGTEPAGSAPLVRAARVEVHLRLFTSLHQLFDVTYLGIEKPRANVLISPDGRTNIPNPKQKSTSNTTALETVVDLAVGHFELTNGILAFNDQKQALNVRGENLRAELWYNTLKQNYTGRLSMQPLYVISGKNTPVKFTVTLPLALQRDRIDIHDAKITTDKSRLSIEASVENMRDLKTTVRLNGHLALVDLKSIGDLPVALNARNVPAMVDIDANATVSNNTIQVTGLRLGAGHSEIEASGTLKDPKGNGSLAIRSNLALGELGRLANITARPDGTVLLNGTAKLDANNDYQLNGNVEGKGLSFQQGAERIKDVNLFSALHVDPRRVDLNGMKLSVFGGEFAGNASLEDFARYKLNGDLRHLDLKAAARAAGQKTLPYDGIVSGPINAQGDLKAPGTKGIVAHAHLSIAPGRQGVPVSGRLNADYNGTTDSINVTNSYLALPHSRIDLNGTIGNRLKISLTTRNLNDLLAAVPMKTKFPVTLNGGEASFQGEMTGSLASPRIDGHLTVNRFSVEGRQFDTLALDLNASKSGAKISNGMLDRGPMKAQFAAAVGLHDWSPTPKQPLTADASIQNGDLADMMALAGQPAAGYSGALTANAHVGGTVGNPAGTLNLAVANGAIHGEPFDRMQAQVNMADQLVTIPTAFIAAGSARVNLKAEYQHPRDSFTTGWLHARVQSNDVNLAQLRGLQKERPNTAGLLRIDADVTGNLSDVKKGRKEQTEFLLSSVNADASAKSLRFDGQNYGDFNATAQTSGQTVNYNVSSNFAGSNIKVNGNTRLVADYPTTADATIGNLPIQRMLALAKRSDIPARGSLSGKAHFQGTVQNPQGNVDLDLANAVIYDEPLDHVKARVTYLANSIDVPQFEVVSGPSRIDLTAKYDHSTGNLQAGNLQFRVNSSRIDLARIRNIGKIRPGLGGNLQIAANGTAAVREKSPQILFRDLNADVKATGLAAQGKNFGDLALTANTTGGKLNFALDSNLANASIHGRGSAELAGDYPVSAQLTFKDLMWTHVQALLGPSTGEPPDFEAVADGQLSVNGPALNTDNLRGSVQVTRLQANTIPRAGGPARPITIRNQGPIVASLDGGTARIDSLHLTGPQTDLQATGTVSMTSRSLNLNLNANTNLGLLQQFDRDFVSSGSIVLATTVRGSMTKPLINGRLELHNASVNDVNFPNGISNANGVVLFSGNSATVRNLTAESGGGKITVGGFATFAETLRFGLRANAANVRVRIQQGVSLVADGNINLTGTTKTSIVSGTVTVNQINYSPQSDFGSILSRAGPPVQAPTAPSPLLDNMKLDIRVRTSSSLAVQASLAQNLQADADLRIRGTASQPGVLGRVSINEGQLVFFGSTYTVNSGTISFYNPARIEPVLNISLETQAKGVDVVLRVTGPIDNMKLSYTSDPPLQFVEIVSLLASGKTPTSDPTILAGQPSEPPQSFQQMGESALVSKALVDPVASRLQRVFGVSQLKIDPTFTSGSELPQARLTLQQQISSSITFTYVTALNDPNTQIIRIEWALDPQWSVISQRDQNGLFSIEFFYKKQFR
ncbi:MAG: translocation/assembly module TamB domain-containing protein [Acidobacteriota bacterium]|nr:translocation/assembly module TamB domain-containing protein [Acidobacteriota bacterium]